MVQNLEEKRWIQSLNRSEKQSVNDFSTEIHKTPHLEVGWIKLYPKK
jgi:hypothetical protein